MEGLWVLDMSYNYCIVHEGYVTNGSGGCPSPQDTLMHALKFDLIPVNFLGYSNGLCLVYRGGIVLDHIVPTLFTTLFHLLGSG